MADPTYEQLLTRFAALGASAVPFDGVVYRSSTPKYATELDLFTGAGSLATGGRWNPAGLAMVYFSFSPETAMAETLYRNRSFGLPVEDLMPRTFVAVCVKLAKVLDLRDGHVRQRLQVSVAKLLRVDWRAEVHAGRLPMSQQVGRAAHATRWEGLIVPSAADRGGHNLLTFPDGLGPSSEITLLNADELPKV